MKKLVIRRVVAIFLFFGAMVVHASSGLPMVKESTAVFSGNHLAELLINDELLKKDKKKLNATVQNYLDAFKLLRPDLGIINKKALLVYLRSLNVVTCPQDVSRTPRGIFYQLSAVSGNDISIISRQFYKGEKCLADPQTSEIIISLFCGNVAAPVDPSNSGVIKQLNGLGVDEHKEFNLANDPSLYSPYREQLREIAITDYSSFPEPREEDKSWGWKEWTLTAVAFGILVAIVHNHNKDKDKNDKPDPQIPNTVDGAGNNGNSENGTSMGGPNGQGSVAASLSF